MYASDYPASARMKFVYAVYYVYASGTVASYKFWLLETFGSLEPNLPGIEARKKKGSERKCLPKQIRFDWDWNTFL